MLVWPQFNPVALKVGPLAVHWYGLAYVAALLGGLSFSKRLTIRHPARGLNADTIESAFLWVALGVILGGRLGYVLFYAPAQYLAHPLAVLQVWQGGMSFHGGMLGVILAMLLFCWRRGIHPADLADRVVPAVPLGLLLGRVANFINGELWGKPVANPEATPWAMVFPHVDALPRHPSQLYEAGLEGLVLGAVLLLVTRRGIRRWLPSGIFLTGYALSRIFAEIFRVPEITHDLGPVFLSQGQLLSLPMLAFGLWLMYLGSRNAKPVSATSAPKPRRKHAA